MFVRETELDLNGHESVPFDMGGWGCYLLVLTILLDKAIYNLSFDDKSQLQPPTKIKLGFLPPIVFFSKSDAVFVA